MTCTTCGPSLLAQTGHVQETLTPSASLSLTGVDSDGSFSFSLPWLLVLLFLAMWAGRKVL